MQLGLNEAQLAERRLGIYGTDAPRIMAGELLPLWREKLGLAEPQDLWDTLHPVNDYWLLRNYSRERMDLARMMGHFTEPFNLAWCERSIGREVQYFSAHPLARLCWEHLTGRPAIAAVRRQHPSIPYMACNSDAMTTTASGEPLYLDAKAFAKLDEAALLRVTAQMTHNALCWDIDRWALSVLIGNSKWQLVEQEVDPFYAAELLTREREFWGYVERREEPPALAAEPVLPPKPAPTLRIVQLEDQFRAEWPNWGAEMVERFGTFAGTWNAYTAHNISREEIKRLMPEDVVTVTRGRIKVARDKAGAIRMNLLKDPGEKANG